MKLHRPLLTRICLSWAYGGMACIASSASFGADLRAAQDAELQGAMERVVADAGLRDEVAQGRLALALVDTTDPAAPRLAMLNGDRMMYAASMPKVAILSATPSKPRSSTSIARTA